MNLTARVFAIAGCLLLTAAGALGAYGFHGLDGGSREAWGWAVQMQFYHGLGLLLVAALALQLGASAWLRLAGVLMIAGVLLFSGLIYAQSLGGPESLGGPVPTGGLCLMLSWLALAVAMLRRRPPRH